MPRLSDSQFQEYEFRAQKAEDATTVAVGRRDPYDAGYYSPVGSMRISNPSMSSQNFLQADINSGRRDARTGEKGNQRRQDPGGQQRWGGGTMDPAPSRVSWLGMSESAPKSLLRGMMGLAVAAHGSVPVADYDLSQYGAKISQGAARKYGVKSHPLNPEMESSFTYDEPEVDENGNEYDEAQSEVQAQAAGHWAMSTNPEVHHQGEGFREDRWQAFSAAQVHGITQDVEKNMLGKRLRVDSRVPTHPSQGKLF